MNTILCFPPFLTEAHHATTSLEQEILSKNLPAGSKCQD